MLLNFSTGILLKNMSFNFIYIFCSVYYIPNVCMMSPYNILINFFFLLFLLLYLLVLNLVYLLEQNWCKTQLYNEFQVTQFHYGIQHLHKLRTYCLGKYEVYEVYGMYKFYKPSEIFVPRCIISTCMHIF